MREEGVYKKKACHFIKWHYISNTINILINMVSL